MFCVSIRLLSVWDGRDHGVQHAAIPDKYELHSGQTGIVSAMDTQKSSGLFGMENKTTSNTSGSSPFKTGDMFSSGGPGIHSLDHSTGIRNRVGCMFHCMLGAVGEGGVSQEKEEEVRIYIVWF